MQSELIQKECLEVYIFDNGSIYSLGVGLFESRTDARLESLKKHFAADSGPPTARGSKPYQGCSPERVGDLGKPVM